MNHKPQRPRNVANLNEPLARARTVGQSADPFANLVEYRTSGAYQRMPPSPYDRSLDRSAVNWLHELPAAVRPREAPLRFPRILNRLARYWDSPRMLNEIFGDLLVDKRVGRKGFPADVLVEIRNLYAYFKSRYPEQNDDRWESVPDRNRRLRGRY